MKTAKTSYGRRPKGGHRSAISNGEHPYAGNNRACKKCHG